MLVKKFYLVLIICLFVFLFGFSNIGAAPKVRLSLWHFGGLPSEIDWIKKACDDFNASHPDIQIEWSAQNWGEMNQKLVTAYNTNTMPDLILGGCWLAADFGAQMHALLALDKEFPEEFAKIKANIVQPALDTVTADGHTWLLPTFMDLKPMLAYNKELFRKAGLNPERPPKTWDELTSYARRLTRNGVYGLGLDGGDPPNPGLSTDSWVEMLYANGGRYINEEKTRFIFNDKAGEATLQFWYDLINKYRVCPPSVFTNNYMENAKLLFAGKIAMCRAETWMPGVAEQLGAPKDFPLGLAPYPVPKTPVGPYKPINRFVGTYADIGISSTTAHKKEAWEFVKYLMNDKVLQGWVKPIAARVPVSISVLQSDFCKTYARQYYDAYKDGSLLKGVEANPTTIPGQAEVNRLVGLELQQALLGKKSIKAALDAAVEQANKALERMK